MATSILIAEDDPLLRNLVERILADETDFQVIGTAANGAEALDAAEQLRPDVLLLDLNMPRLSGLDVLERLAERGRGPAVLVLTTEEDEDTQLTAARSGAKGFLPKSKAVRDLTEAVRAVANGEYWFSRRISSLIFSEFPVLARRVRQAERPINQLTEREREVLIRVARGMTNSQIAKDLCMSVSTVKTHVQNIFQKFDLPNRTEAAVFAVRQGLLEEGDATVRS